MINKFDLVATNKIHPPKRGEKERLYTWTSGDGKVQKQLDYILTSNNIRTWCNYSKTKGTANPNSENQHKLICMEIMAKWRHGQYSAELNKHVNFNIIAMRENKEKLIISLIDPDRKRAEEMNKEMEEKRTKIDKIMKDSGNNCKQHYKRNRKPNPHKEKRKTKHQ